jgi:outer membrane protein OmpA-like peptidoglycan-associated protein
MMRRLSSSIELRLVFLAGVLALAAACKTTPGRRRECRWQRYRQRVRRRRRGRGRRARVTATTRTPPRAWLRSTSTLDKSDIKPQFESILEAAAATLKSSGGSALIEGHCDERGSDEYNVALGERRAVSVRRYLYNLGVPVSQLSVVSYGEARPAVSGTGETAWSLNRRAEIKLQ